MKRQQRRMQSWKILKRHTNWEEGINFVHALRKKHLRCFVIGKPGNYFTYIHPEDESKVI